MNKQNSIDRTAESDLKVVPRPSLFYKNLGEEDEATEMTSFSG